MEFLDDETIERLANQITEKYYKFDKGAMKRWGIVGKEKTVYSTKKTLKKLETFVYLNDIDGFLKYLDWLVAVMMSRDIKFKVIYDHTEICYKVIKSEGMKEKNKSKQNSAKKCIKFLEKGLEYLKNYSAMPAKSSVKK